MEVHSGGGGQPWAHYNPQCGLFEFIVDVILMGTLCVLGFAGNTLSFIVLWQERAGGGGGAGAGTLLLQAVVLADMAVLWTLFLGDVMPGLAYAVPLLRACHSVCGYVAAVSAPLLLLARLCALWLTLAAVAQRYVALCRPALAPLAATVSAARRHVLGIVLTAALVTLPQTFDSSLVVPGPGPGAVAGAGADNHGGHGHSINSSSHHTDIGIGEAEGVVLSEHPMYRLLYLHIGLLICGHVIPLLALLYFSLRLTLGLQSVRRVRRALAQHKADSLDMPQVLLTLAVTALICYCPLLARHAVEWSDGRALMLCGHLQYYLDSFSKMFLALNSSLKLLILCLFAKRFCRCLKDTFCSVSTSKSDFNIFGMYRCQDASEMTLISQMDRNDPATEPLEPI